MNVYPLEVEQVLLGCPGVEDVAVVGAPDERWGQRDFAAGRPAPYKRPKDVYVVDDLPRTATGKVRRSAVAGRLGLDG